MFEGIDLDWFAIGASNNVIHLASAGGILPSVIDERISDVAEAILGMPEISPEVMISESLGDYVQFSNRSQYSNYVASFLVYAKRGLFSYDKTLLNDNSSPLYHLVAAPTNVLKADSLPEEIRGLIPGIKLYSSLSLTEINIELLF